MGPVPSGKFPAPVHVSLQSQTSCSTSFSKGQHALLQAAPWGRVVVWPPDRPPQKKEDAFLPSACPKAEMKGTSGTLPAALGACGVGIWLCATSRMGQGVTPISFGLEVMRRKREIPPTSQDLGLLCFFIFTPAPDCLRCSCLPA